MRTEFSASYDRTTKILTGISCAVLLGVAAVTQQPFVLVLSMLIIGLSYGYSPRGYTVSQGEIIVKRMAGNVRLSLTGTLDLRRATVDDLTGTLRLFGCGGMFGYYGLFRTSKLGRAWWYVTDRKNIVIVVTGSGVTLISPDDVDGLLAACSQFVTITQAPYGETSGASGLWRSPAIWIGIGLGILSIGIVAAALLYAPGPPKLTLTADALTVHDRFYPVTVAAADVDVGRAQVIDIRTDRDWRPTARTNGFANSHYRAGWFRTANGQRVRMYRADGTKLALLPLKGSTPPILIEVADPDQFLQQVRQEWSRSR